MTEKDYNPQEDTVVWVGRSYSGKKPWTVQQLVQEGIGKRGLKARPGASGRS